MYEILVSKSLVGVVYCVRGRTSDLLFPFFSNFKNSESSKRSFIFSSKRRSKKLETDAALQRQAL